MENQLGSQKGGQSCTGHTSSYLCLDLLIRLQKMDFRGGE